MMNIEKDIPLPLELSPTSPYPFAGMEVGDSFLVPMRLGDELDNNKRLCTKVYTACIKASKELNAKFVRKNIAGKGVRVWRIE